MVGASARTRSYGLGARRDGHRHTSRSKKLMARADSLAKLAFAYGVHMTRRRLTRPRSPDAKLLETYPAAGLRPLLPEGRERHPPLIRCINFGLCPLAAPRIG